MGLWARKFRVGLISLGVVLLAFLLYSLISKTPRIEIDTEPEFTKDVDDGNIGRFDGQMGAFGKVGVGPVKKAKYVHLNEQKQVDQELGFDELLHESGNEWEVKKPYLNMYQPDVVCYITADKGRILVESAGGRPRPKVAEFTGNVQAHFVPEASDNAAEGFLYLDDITFVSEKSQFATPGPVKYVSRDAQMLGKGLEFIYNEQLQRIDLLRVVHLQNLKLSTENKDLTSPKNNRVRTPTDANNQTQTGSPIGTVVSDDSQKVKTAPDPNTQDAAQQQDQRYRCVFSKNVVMDSPEQLVFALEKLSIRNIFRPKESGDRSDYTDPCSVDTINKTVPEGDSDVQQELEPNTPASPNSPVINEQSPLDIVVTCDDGFVLTPMDFNSSDSNSPLVDRVQLLAAAREKLEQLKKDDGRNLFIAQEIDYCAATRDTIVMGPSELKFYTSDFMHPDPNKAVIPVTITAQKEARFLPAERQALFKGDSVLTVLRQDPNSQQKYFLSAPRIIVDLQEQKGKQISDMAGKIDHLSAIGPTARLAIVKMVKQELLGGFELKCDAIDYSADVQFFLATGPGIVKVDNSKISETNQDVGRFSLRRQSYSIIENFDTLQYFVETNQVIAEAPGSGLVVNYFPIVDGRYDRHITITAGRIIGDLIQTPAGQTELSTLHAMDGVTYTEGDMEFAGRKLFYDIPASIITVQGDQSQPCLFNGSLVDEIEYDLKNRTAKFRFVGPGTLQRK